MSLGQGDSAKNSDDTLVNRLNKFVEYFVRYYEVKLEEFRGEAGVGGEAKTGKREGMLPISMGAAGAALQLCLGGPVAISRIADIAVGSTVSFFSGKTHRGKAKRVTEVFGRIDENKSLRGILSTASGEIFRCYESQFAWVTDGDGYWNRGMEKLAIDAVDRSIMYISQHEKSIAKVDIDLITMSFTHGTSKGLPVGPVSGHTIFMGNTEWNTSELFNNVGLVTMKEDGTADNYYQKIKDGRRMSSKYGYRRLFQWELRGVLKLMKKLNGEYEVERKIPRDVYEYILNSEDVEKLSGGVLSNMNERDLILTLHRIEKCIVSIHEQLGGIKDNTAMVRQELDAFLPGQDGESSEGIWYSMRLPVVLFTGREDELRDLHQMLQNEGEPGSMPGVAVITGLGGIGKTEISRMYAKEHVNDYDGNVLWINAETNETLRNSFIRLAVELKIPIGEEMDGRIRGRNVRSIVQDVYEYFCEKKGLFVFDNAEGFKGIQEFLPLCLHPNDRKPHVLITSRNREWEADRDGEIGLISLQGLKPGEAENFVKGFLKIRDALQEGSVKAVTVELQYFPLALQQAVVYTKQEDEHSRKRGGNGFGISDYLTKYGQHKRLLLSKGYYKDSDRYTQTVLTTWVATLQKILEDENGVLAMDILNVMVYLAPDNILVEKIISNVSATEDDKENHWKAVELLHQYSMINLEGGVCDVHRLVQQVIRLRLEDENREEGFLERALALVNSGKISGKSHTTSVWTHASKYGNIIREFYFKSDSISTYGYYEFTPMHLLAEVGDDKAVDALLGHLKEDFSNEFSEIINAKDKKGRTSLYVACKKGHVNVLQLLLDNGAAVGTDYEEFCHPALIRAIRSGHVDVVKKLVDWDKMLVYTYDSHYGSPAEYAASNGQVAIVKFLAPGNDEYLLRAEFIAASHSGKTNDLKNLLEIFEENKQLEVIVNLELRGWSPVHLAAANDWVAIVEILLRNGAKIRETEDSYTPLHCASERGHLDVVKRLLKDGEAPALYIDKYGWTSLHGAACNGQLEVVKFYIDDLRLDVNITLKDDVTPLHAAAIGGRLKVVQFLLDRGANIDATTVFGGTPIFYSAMHYNDCGVLEFLLNKGAKVINTTDNGTLNDRLNLSVLHVAAAFNDTEIIEE